MPDPYIGFGNDTLAKQPLLYAGDFIDCPSCNGKHILEDSEPPMLLFYKCGDTLYLAAIDNKSIMGVKADVRGEL